MSVLRVFDFPGENRDVRFATIRPAGFRILAALNDVAKDWPQDIYLTCGTEAHPAGNPHTLGEAYDVRCHDLPTFEAKDALVRAIIGRLSEDSQDVPFRSSGGWAVRRFFGFVELPGNPNEHIHLQRRRGVVFP